MKGLLILASLFISIILLGIGMFKLVRWSRVKNAELKEMEKDTQGEALKKVLHGENMKESIVNYYTSSISKPESFIGKALAIAVILFFVILAVLAGYFA